MPNPAKTERSPKVGAVRAKFHAEQTSDGKYARVPHADVGPIKIENGMEDEKALFLSDIFPTAWMAAENCQIGRGETVAIWGGGPVGQLAIRSAFLQGAGKVILIENIPERIEMGKQSGAEVIDFDADAEENLFDQLKDMTGGFGPDSCIDAVGMEAHGTSPGEIYDWIKMGLRLASDRPNVFRQAIQACRKGGTVSVPGVYAGFLDKIPFGAAFNKGLTFKMGQTHVQRYTHPLLERIEKGEIDPSFIITHRLPIDARRQRRKNRRRRSHARQNPRFHDARIKSGQAVIQGKRKSAPQLSRRAFWLNYLTVNQDYLSANEVEAALKESGALLEGHFLLASGRHSQFYIEKFRLLEQPRLTSKLCAEIARRFENDGIETVVGPVTGGIILAFEVARIMGIRAVYAERAEDGVGFALRRGFSLKNGEKCLVVEDIVTTGGSAQKVVELVRKNGGHVAGCALLVDRSNGALQIDAPRVESLLEMQVESWAPSEEPTWLNEKYGEARKPGTTK